MPEIRSTRIAWIGLAIVTVVWSLSWPFMKLATHYSGPFTFAAQRQVVACAALFALLALQRKNLRPTPWLLTIAIGFFQNIGFNALKQWALMSGGAGKTSLLAYTMPFWVVLLAWWWLHEKPGWRRWLCIGLAAIGYVFVIRPWQLAGSPESIVKAILGGLAWAAATVLIKRMFQKYPDVEPLRLTAWQMLIGTFGLVILALVAHEPAVHWNSTYIGILLYTGVVSSALGGFLWAVIVQRLAANVAGLASLVVPIAAVLFAWLLLGERPSLPEWIGIALIAVALFALQFRGDLSA